MGLLDIYENTITNPKLLTAEYFKERPKVHGMSTWYSYDETTPSGELNTLRYTTYKIPIIKKPIHENRIHIGKFVSVWEDQSVQVATIKFTYDFNSKVLFYSIDKALSVYGKNLPIDSLMLKREGLKEIGELLDIDMLAITPGHLFKDVVSIKDFELIIDGTKSILTKAGYYLPNF